MYARFFNKMALTGAMVAPHVLTGYMVAKETSRLEEKHPDMDVVPKYNYIPGVGGYLKMELVPKQDTTPKP
ncbi:MAG: hypothetical protein WC785_08255 [Tatlockia sp.]|jgi:hypothetical protein